MVDRIVELVVNLMGAIGAPGAGVAVAIENLFPPIPSEVVLPLAGFAASRGQFSLFSAIAWTTAGSLVGAVILYWLGQLFGAERLRQIAAKLPLMKVSDVDKTIAWFERHGTKAVFLGRMVPIFRSLISIPAGVQRMSLPLFMVYTTAGSAIWNSALILAGYGLGENWHVVENYVGVFSKIVAGLVLIALIYFVVRRVRDSRKATPVE